MAKSKKKKQKNADFSKVKLKVGKKKPSAANSTDVSFKSKAINILGQLEEKNEPTNRRNLSLKDILSQLSHYNQNTRQDASYSLKEFFIQHPTSLHQNFSQIMPKLLEKSVDNDHVVRKNFISCLTHIFENVSDQEISPFFPLVMAHLNCAMTHINEDIQLDSLLFLNVCLDSFPKLFMKDNIKVLQSILSLISYKQTEVNSKSNKGQKRNYKGISLLVSQEISSDPTGKISSSKTKRAILESLLKIASLAFDSEIDSDLSKKMGVENIHISKPITNIAISKYPSQLSQWTNNLGANGTRTEESSESKSSCKENSKNLITSYLPVLFQCWNDSKPARNSTSVDFTKDASLSAMLTIVRIVKLTVTEAPMHQTNLNSSVSADFHEEFVKHFMSVFPYSSGDITNNKSPKTTAENSLNDDIVSLNINLCQIYSKLLRPDTSKTNNDFSICKKILSYVQSLMANSEANSFNSHVLAIKDVFQCLLEILTEEEVNEKGTTRPIWAISLFSKEFNLTDDICRTLQDMLQLYKNTNDTTVKLNLLSVLDDFLELLKRSSTEAFNDIVSSWIDILPADLRNATSKKLVLFDRLICIMRKYLQRHATSLKWCDSLATAIRDVVASRNGIMSTNAYGSQKKLIELVFLLPKVPKEIVESFAFLCHIEDTPASVKQKIISILFFCFKEKKSLDLSLLLSFAFSVVLGTPIAKLQCLQKPQISSYDSKHASCLKYVLLDENQDGNSTSISNFVCEKQLNSIQLILDMLQTLDFKEDLFYLFKPSFDRILLEFKTLPTKLVFNILFFFKSIYAWGRTSSTDEDSDFSQRLSELIFAIIISLSMKIKETNMKQQIFINNFFCLITGILIDNNIMFGNLLELINSALVTGQIYDEVIARGIFKLKTNEKLKTTIDDIIKEDKFFKLRKMMESVSNSFLLLI